MMFRQCELFLCRAYCDEPGLTCFECPHWVTGYDDSSDDDLKAEDSEKSTFLDESC